MKHLYMKIFRTSQIKSIDAYTIQNEPISSINLMERAATKIAEWIVEEFHVSTPIKIFAGPGNNGGDAWAVARILANRGFSNLSLFLLNIADRISEDSEINRKRLIEQNLVKIYEVSNEKSFPEIQPDDLIVDGLFGSGLTRPLEGLASRLVRYINNSNVEVIAIDVPSGLFGEDNSKNIRENILKATFTLTFQFPKVSFFFAENDEYVGNWYVLPIGLHKDIIDKTPSEIQYISPDDIKRIIPKRQKFSHKGTYGHALLIAGSYGMMGAAVLAAKACLRSGVGLVTSHIPRAGVPIIQTGVPESLTNSDTSETMFSEIPELKRYTGIAVGPGIGMHEETARALKELVEACDKPMVIDADALNILGEHRDLLKLIPKKSILTPHPKEFERIAGESKNSYQRNQKQIELAQELGIYIVLKGAYTSIAFPDGTCYFNSTGNPGMATGGSGDVLTGILLSLLTQGYTPADSVIAGVYLHGLAADIAQSVRGEYSLIPSDIIEYLGKAFLHVQNSK